MTDIFTVADKLRKLKEYEDLGYPPEDLSKALEIATSILKLILSEDGSARLSAFVEMDRYVSDLYKSGGGIDWESKIVPKVIPTMSNTSIK